MEFKRGYSWLLVGFLILIILNSFLVSAWRPDFLKTKAYYNEQIVTLEKEKADLIQKYPTYSSLVETKIGWWPFRTTVAEKIAKIDAEIKSLQEKRDAKSNAPEVSPATGINIVPAPQWWEDLKDETKNPTIAPFIKNWESGAISCEIIKLFLLILIILLIFSSFVFVDFPPGYILKTLVSVLLGLAITWLITPKEVCSMLLGYKAVGISLMIFFPILILAFFSFVVAFKMKNPFGLMAQRIMWLVYSVFLILRTIAYFLNMVGIGSENQGMLVTLAKQLGKLAWNATIGGAVTENTGDLVLIGIIHFIVALAVLWIFVFRNQDFLRYIYEKRMEAEVLTEKEKFKKARAARDVYAEALGGK